MAIVQVLEIYEADFRADNAPSKTAMRRFKIQTDTAYQQPIEFHNDTVNLPQRGDLHPSDSSLILSRVEIIPREDSPFWHDATYEYSSLVAGPGPDEDDENTPPDERAPEITWGYSTTTEDVFNEVDQGQASPLPQLPWLQTSIEEREIVNTAGDRFDPLLQRERSYLQVTLTLYRRGFTPAQANAQQDHVNHADWFGFAAETVRITSLAGQIEIVNGQEFHRLTYVLTVKPEGWNPEILNEGYHHRVIFGNFLLGADKVLNVDRFDQETKTPQSLALNGRLLRDGENKVYLKFRIYRLADFNEIFPVLP